jgi:hypothetical protein
MRQYKFTEEHRRRISESMKLYVMTDEHKQNISVALKGLRKNVPLSKEHRRNLIKAMACTVTCPHCGTQGGKAIMMRWHFDRCRRK